MIQVNNYSFSFKNKLALDNINISFEKGLLYGILGPNSSGKTTLFESLSGRYVGYGEIVVDGKNDPREIQDKVSRYLFVNDRSRNLSIRLPIYVYQKIRKDKRVDIDGFNINMYKKYLNKMNIDLSKFSLNIGTNFSSFLLCHLLYTMSVDSEYYILDEPFNGLDYKHRSVILEMALERVNEGKTVIISSHNADVLDTCCDIYYFLDKGKVIKKIDSIDKELSIKELYVNTYSGGVNNA